LDLVEMKTTLLNLPHL